MTARLLRAALLVPALLAGSLAYAFDLDQLAAQLGKPAVVRGPFVQEKHLRALPRPLTSEGHFVLSREQGLLWLLRKPLQQDYRIGAAGIARRVDGQCRPSPARTSPPSRAACSSPCSRVTTRAWPATSSCSSAATPRTGSCT